LVESATGLVVLWIGSKWRPALKFSGPHLRDILRYGAHLLLINGLNFFSLRADSLIVGYFLGSTALGLYTVTQRLFQFLLDLLYGTINQVAMSIFARLQADPARLKTAFLTAVRWTSLASFPVFAMLIVLADPIVPLMFGAQWAQVAPVVSILAWVGCCSRFRITTVAR
jgi:O-antigen/teichoic acid export membrane protein